MLAKSTLFIKKSAGMKGFRLSSHQIIT